MNGIYQLLLKLLNFINNLRSWSFELQYQIQIDWMSEKNYFDFKSEMNFFICLGIIISHNLQQCITYYWWKHLKNYLISNRGLIHFLLKFFWNIRIFSEFYRMHTKFYKIISISRIDILMFCNWRKIFISPLIRQRSLSNPLIYSRYWFLLFKSTFVILHSW